MTGLARAQPSAGVAQILPELPRGEVLMSKRLPDDNYIRWLETLGSGDVAIVGGKNASLGEMLQTLGQKGIRVPSGFATTASAYREFISQNQLLDPLRSLLDDLAHQRKSLDVASRAIRRLFLRGEFPEPIADAIRNAYEALGRRYETDEVDVAVRSSATAEDLPEASFAGQQETFLNISGVEELMDAYRQHHGFDHLDVALSIGVQKMVRSDSGSAGVMFSIDTETGFPDVVVINASWGLGENVVKGTVTPDEYVVFKPLLGQAGLVPIVGKTLGSKMQKLVYARGGKPDHAQRRHIEGGTPRVHAGRCRCAAAGAVGRDRRRALSPAARI